MDTRDLQHKTNLLENLKELLVSIGEDPSRDGLKKHPIGS